MVDWHSQSVSAICVSLWCHRRSLKKWHNHSWSRIDVYTSLNLKQCSNHSFSTFLLRGSFSPCQVSLLAHTDTPVEMCIFLSFPTFWPQGSRTQTPKTIFPELKNTLSQSTKLYRNNTKLIWNGLYPPTWRKRNILIIFISMQLTSMLLDHLEQWEAPNWISSQFHFLQCVIFSST